MKYTLGFDLSLSAPAAVAIPHNWRPGSWRSIRAWLLNTETADDARGLYRRYIEISTWASSVARSIGWPSEYAIEQYAFSRNNAQASRLMELGGVVRVDLFRARKMAATVVATASARKLLMGKVPPGDQKLAVQLALFKAGAPKAWDENIIDAFVIANYFRSSTTDKPALMLHDGDGSRRKRS